MLCGGVRVAVGMYASAGMRTFRPRTVATAYTLPHNEGTKIGEIPASVTPTRPESTDNARQRTTRNARRIARYAAIAGAQASANLATDVGASADLTSAVRAPADLTSAVHAPAGLPIAVSTTVCHSMGVLPPGEASNAPFLSFSPHQTPSRPAAPFRSATSSRPRPPRLRLSLAKTCHTKVAQAARQSALENLAHRSVVAGRVRPQRPAPPLDRPVSPLPLRDRWISSPRVRKMPGWKRRPPAKTKGDPPSKGSGARWGTRPAKDKMGPRPAGDWSGPRSTRISRRRGLCPLRICKKATRSWRLRCGCGESTSNGNKCSKRSIRFGRGRPRSSPQRPTPRGSRCPCR